MMSSAQKTVWVLVASVVASGWTTSAFAQAGTQTTTATATTTPKAKTSKTRKPRLYDAAGTASASGVTSTSSTTTKKTTRVRGTSYTRVIHAIAGGPAVDVYVDGKKVLSNVAYKSVSDYMAVPTGKHTFKVSAAGKSDALVSADLTNTKDKFYTVAAYGTPEKPLLLRVNEATGKEIEGKGRVYVVHLAQAAAVDVTTPSTRNKTTGYASFLKAVPPGTSRAKSATPGDVKLQVRADGKVVKEVDAKIEAGKRYTVFAIGSASALDLIVKPSAIKPNSTP